MQRAAVSVDREGRKYRGESSVMLLRSCLPRKAGAGAEGTEVLSVGESDLLSTLSYQATRLPAVSHSGGNRILHC